MKIKTNKTALEKQPAGVLSGIQILWRDEFMEHAATRIHGAAVAQPNSKFELSEELFFLAEVAGCRYRIEISKRAGVES